MPVEVNLISEDKVKEMGSAEKLRFILDFVKAGKIVVLEGGLTAEEQMKLIEFTMSQIDENFTGIEISSYPSKRGFLRKKTRLTIIGPANLIKTINKDKNWIRAVIQD